MSNKKKKKEIAIIGGGLSGTVLAYILASNDHKVTIYEKRSDCRLDLLKQGRSVNLTLAERGIKSLEKIGISREKLFSMCIGLEGRQVHQSNGKQKFQPYGKKSDEVIYSIIRYDLNCFLLDYVEKHPNIKILFDQKCIKLDKNNRTVSIKDKKKDETYTINPEILIGADGTFSKVKQQMQKGVRADYTQFFLDCGYKEIIIPPDENGNYRLKPNALHVWPRGEALLLALSNNDGSFTCTCMLPHTGEISFASLNTTEKCQKYFEKSFPDFVDLIPAVTLDNLVESPINEFITTKTSMWFYKDWIVLIGDACHTVTPFYGQGMNTALEGCWILADAIEEYPKDLQTAFDVYQNRRKINTDILADISVKNYYELRDKVRYPSIDFKKKINFLVQQLFPDKWLPLYTMIAHTDIPYAEAIEIERKQNRILNWFGIGVISYLMNLGAGIKIKINGKGKDIKRDAGDYKSPGVVKKQDSLGH